MEFGQRPRLAVFKVVIRLCPPPALPSKFGQKGKKRRSWETGRTSTMEEIRLALFPLVTIWDTLVIRAVGSDPRNKPLQNLRKHKVAQKEYLHMRNIISKGLHHCGAKFSRYWWIWAACVRQFRIHETLTWNELTTTAHQIQRENFDAPWLLAGTPARKLATWSSPTALRGGHSYGDAQNSAHLMRYPVLRNRKLPLKRTPSALSNS